MIRIESDRVGSIWLCRDTRESWLGGHKLSGGHGTSAITSTLNFLTLSLLLLLGYLSLFNCSLLFLFLFVKGTSKIEGAPGVIAHIKLIVKI